MVRARPKKKRASTVEIVESERPLEALRKFLAKIRAKATVQQGQIALGAAHLALAGDDPDAAEIIDLVLDHWERFPDRSGFHAEAFLHNAFEADGDPERLERLLMYATASGIDLLVEEVPLPEIPVHIAPHVPRVRRAVDALVTELDRLGQPATTNPPATLDDVLAAERASRIQLPNDYRAMLTITDGLAAWDHTFFGTKDLRGAALVRDCVPIASSTKPTEWLLYDPRGGYLFADQPVADLVTVLDRIGKIAADMLATN
ncbi:MAG: hypothetical protein AB7T06_36605, partial [Kofleriaceae bacterium]